MCSKNSCGLLWSVLVAGLVLTALVVPWYVKYDQLGVASDASSMCSRVTSYGWKQAHCVVADGHYPTPGIVTDNTMCSSNFTKDILSEFVCPHGSSYAWSDAANCENCEHRAKVFTVSMWLLVLSGICIAVGLLGFFLRLCCESREQGQSYLHFVVQVIGFLSLATSVAFFAISLPTAYNNDQACPQFYITGEQVGDVSECHKFFGSYTGSTLLNTLQYMHVWGPLGWIAAAVALPLYLVVVCLSTARRASGSNLQEKDVPIGVYTRY
jgi:hypothetical protein